MIATLEDQSKRAFGRLGLFGLGMGFYFGLYELVVISSVIIGIFVVDLYLKIKENGE